MASNWNERAWWPEPDEADVSLARENLEQILYAYQENPDKVKESLKYKDEVVNRKEELDKDKFRSPLYKCGSGEIKRRKRGPNSDEEDNYKESFVIKVFERSVDFGQFGENSPLYPMARAWIRNLNQSDTSSWNDIPNQDEEREGNDQLPDCHYALPKPSDGLSDNEVRVPPPLPSPGQPFVINVENPPKEMSPEGLLEQHITRWREIRRK
ncbi:unnamed protein product [Dibothriocephalus latus]|uniref:Protein lin-37 homolog n=1 Tax=Dibothriocephalus latus TaxID=60516 RepID=A0A3P6QLC8_DIBLA|nr:unnamed protein product [Dibothriocephalus latus]